MRHPVSNTIVLALCAAGVALTTSACALTSKADIVDVRYFSPERVKPQLKGPDSTAAPGAAAPDGALRVRLGRVSSGPNLRERIAYRNAAHELGYYDGLQWAERPETYVRRELGHSLFEAHRIHHVLSGASPTLDVEVIAFDDLRLGTTRAARVQLKIILYDDNGVMLEDTLTVDHPVAGDKPKIEDVVAAMGTALDAAANQVTLRVQEALAARRSAISTDAGP